MTDLLFTPALDRYLVDTADEREPDGYFHPSSLYQCDRQAIYEVKGVPRTDEKSPEDHRPLVMGKLLHTLAQAAVSHGAGGRIVQAYHEVKVTIPDLDITGSADSLVFLDDGTVELEEFKSTKSTGIKYAKGGFKPKDNHVGQALTYIYGIRNHEWRTEDPETGMYTFHEPLGDRLRTARITYLGKDNFEILEFLYDITPEWEASFREYMENLHRYRDGDVLPPRLAREDGGKKSWLCNWCSWRSRCWNVDGEGEERFAVR